MFRIGMIRRSFPALLLIIAVGIAVVSVVALNLAATAGAYQQTVVTFVPPGSVHSGEVVTVRLVANNAHNLAGFQGAVSFDTTNLKLEQAVVADDLKRSGRDVMPFMPALHGNAVVLGAATCPIAKCTDAHGILAARVLQGVDGDVDLATLSFQAGAPGQYELRIDNVQLVDPQGNKLAMTTRSAVITVSAR